MHILCGILAGIVYSVMGWMKNIVETPEWFKERTEIAETIANVKEKELREKVKEIVSDVFTYIDDWYLAFQKSFDLKKFIVTVIEGFMIGILIALLNVKVDIAESILMQTGILTLLRKALKIAS